MTEVEKQVLLPWERYIHLTKNKDNTTPETPVDKTSSEPSTTHTETLPAIETLPPIEQDQEKDKEEKLQVDTPNLFLSVPAHTFTNNQPQAVSNSTSPTEQSSSTSTTHIHAATCIKRKKQKKTLS
jgi:hypothetical protein